MPQISQKEFDLLALRQLSGETSSRENLRLHDLLHSKQWIARFAILQGIWGASGMRPTVTFDVEAAAKRLAASIGAKTISAKSKPATKSKVGKSKAPGQTIRRAKLRPETRPSS